MDLMRMFGLSIKTQVNLHAASARGNSIQERYVDYISLHKNQKSEQLIFKRECRCGILWYYMKNGDLKNKKKIDFSNLSVGGIKCISQA